MKLFVSLILLLTTITVVITAKKMIHPTVNICLRNDPNLSACFKENFKKMLPLMKSGIPEMNIVPIEPVHVEKVRMDFPQSQSVKLTADLKDMKVWGLGSTIVDDITVQSIGDTLTMNIDLIIPSITMVSDYTAVGKFLVLNIDAVGNYTGDFRDLHVKTKWTSKLYKKKDRDHLSWQCNIEQLTIKKLSIQFNNLFGNQTELTDNTNKVINENIDSLYDEISPVIKETINSVATNIVNHVYDLFPLDVLFPKS
ncbi:uncharacterized protein [Atheta coriaria]|uniref:uncharacterized protein n=1 Tax=Dalotia coriaria TaxID=877792 RepID=UPI0031F47473